MIKKEQPDETLPGSGPAIDSSSSSSKKVNEGRVGTKQKVEDVFQARLISIYQNLLTAIGMNADMWQRDLQNAVVAMDGAEKRRITDMYRKQRRLYVTLAFSELFEAGEGHVGEREVRNILRIWLGVEKFDSKKTNQSPRTHYQIAIWAKSILTLMRDGRPIINLLQEIDSGINERTEIRHAGVNYGETQPYESSLDAGAAGDRRTEESMREIDHLNGLRGSVWKK